MTTGEFSCSPSIMHENIMSKYFVTYSIDFKINQEQILEFLIDNYLGYYSFHVKT